MNKLILLVLLAGCAAAQTVYEREPGTGYCEVTAATNTTPVQLTVSNYSYCGVAEGGLIAVEGVGGNTAANWNPGATAGTTTQLARKVKAGSLTVNGGANTATFSLTDLADVDVAGNGAYTNGGWVGKVVARTLRADPIIYLDGPSGTFTGTMAAKAVGTNAAWNAVVATRNAHVALTEGWGRALGNGAQAFLYTAASAIKHWSDGDVTAGNAAYYDLMRVEQFWCGGAMDLTLGNSGTPGSLCMDYGGGGVGAQVALTMTLLNAAGKLSAGDRTTLAQALWNGAAWNAGGSDYTGESVSVHPFLIHGGSTPDYTHGTVSYTAGQTTINGTGTSFLTDLAPDRIIYIPHPLESNYAVPFRVVSCASDTLCTVASSSSSNLSGHFATAAPWTASSPGFHYYQCGMTFSVLCGASSANTLSLIAGANPASLGIYGTPPLMHNNLSLHRLNGLYLLGLVTCGWGDQRGCWMAARAHAWLQDHTLRFYLQITSNGNNPGTTHYYNHWRVGAAIYEWELARKRSFSTAFAANLPSTYVQRGLRRGPMNWVGQYGWMAWSEVGVTSDTDEALAIDLTLAQLAGSSEPLAQQYYDFLVNKRGGLKTGLSNTSYIKNYFLFEPSHPTSAVPTTSWVANETNTADCVALYGSARCTFQGRGAFSAMSKTSFASNRHATLTAISPGDLDHAGQGITQLSIAQGAGSNSKLLIGGGSSGGGEIVGPEHRSYVMVGSNANVRSAYQGTAPTAVQGRGDTDFLAAEVEYSAWYQAAANVTAAHKSWIHFKAGGRDFHVVRERVAASSAAAMRGQYLMPLASCGTPASSACLSANRAAKTWQHQYTGIGGIVAKAVSLGGNILLTTENNSDTDLSYTGGNIGGKVQVCATANGTTCDATNTELEYAVVMEQTGGSGSLPTIVSGLSGTLRVVEIQHSTLPAVGVLGPAGGSVTFGTFTTTHSGTAQYVLSNLQPGSISVDRGGSPVSGSPFTVGADGVITFDSVSGSFSMGGAVPQAADPAFLPVAGVYGSPQTVSISTTTPGASIRYTTDGSTPTSSSGTVYSVPVYIPTTATLKAIAYAGGYTDSNVTTGVYTITSSGPGFAIRMR